MFAARFFNKWGELCVVLVRIPLPYSRHLAKCCKKFCHLKNYRAKLVKKCNSNLYFLQILKGRIKTLSDYPKKTVEIFMKFGF